MINLNNLKEIHVKTAEYKGQTLIKKEVPNKVTTIIRVTARARDLVNAYKLITGAANPSEVLE